MSGKHQVTTATSIVRDPCSQWEGLTGPTSKVGREFLFNLKPDFKPTKQPSIQTNTVDWSDFRQAWLLGPLNMQSNLIVNTVHESVGSKEEMLKNLFADTLLNPSFHYMTTGTSPYESYVESSANQALSCPVRIDEMYYLEPGKFSVSIRGRLAELLPPKSYIIDGPGYILDAHKVPEDKRKYATFYQVKVREFKDTHDYSDAIMSVPEIRDSGFKRGQSAITRISESDVRFSRDNLTTVNLPCDEREHAEILYAILVGLCHEGDFKGAKKLLEDLEREWGVISWYGVSDESNLSSVFHSRRNN